MAEHWNTYMDDDGKMNTDVETAYGRIEGSVMRRIREINFRNCDQKHHEAIVHLFAIHLVRSRSYNLFYESVRDSVLPRFVSEIVEDPRTDELFQAENGRSAVVGELRSIVTTHVDRMFRNKRDSVQSAVTTSGAIVGRLRGLHIQVIELDSSLPGFVLGDVPIVHANLEQKRFGFRDRLAIDDADLIMGPLSRRVLVCFTPDRVQSKLLRSKKKSQGSMRSCYMRVIAKFRVIRMTN